MEDPMFFHNLKEGKQPRGVTARVLRKWAYHGNEAHEAPLYVGMVLADARVPSFKCPIILHFTFLHFQIPFLLIATGIDICYANLACPCDNRENPCTPKLTAN
jgi:hypothetical protein